ncbi:imidazole glycerol phosphate synthase subunit HisH [Acetanaerobacterium elongatum]|uniref:Imidazole glycerol phosphate synthase subunit HisH n=1 Tax=Acetanaerobacterium elongatum TaxID=258515 RepID=A0A1H0BFL3_9FIRM|nr:imidazole glycerol phosphate synthase subunit HisH [Acetanaerobacterium elongatum]SDN44412.1 glutamine amidotransferase [Acetanaerobacterium elongatum]
MIAIIDYGAGNLFSVKNALNYIGFESCFTKDADELRKADKLILPGVGAFPDAMKMLNASGLVPTIKEQALKKPLLGICLGMQILFEKGYEFYECEGLGLIEGSVKKIESCGLKIPHIGWNDLTALTPCPLMNDVPEQSYVYFDHSFCAETADEHIAAYTTYGQRVPALVMSGMVYGAQYHPEKSGNVGLTMLKNFCTL